MGTDQIWKAEDYADLVVEFSKAMKAVDPTIRIGANGSLPEWWKVVLERARDHIDFLSVHQYSSFPSSEYGKWKDTWWAGSGDINYALKALKEHGAHRADHIDIAVTEISSLSPNKDFWPNIAKVLELFEMLGAAFEQPKVKQTHFWVSQWNSFKMGALTPNAKLRPMGHPINIWGKYAQPEMIKVKPRVNGFLRTYATASKDKKQLSIFVMNKDSKPHPITINVQNYEGKTKNDLYILDSKTGNDPGSVAIRTQKAPGLPWHQDHLQYEAPPFSLTVIHFKPPAQPKQPTTN